MLTVKGKGSQLIATAVLLAFCACGNQSDLQGLQAVPVGQGTPQPRQSGLGEAMEEVQAAPLPAGVDLELWEELKAELAPHATVLFEPLDPDPERFLDPLAYVFVAPVLEDDGATRLVVLVQFKTYPMGDPDHFEVNGLQRGTCIYQFGGIARQEIKLVSLICSDAFAFLDPQAEVVYDRGLVIHIQLNPKPRQEQFRLYRDRLLRFQGDATELICLNWAGNVHLRSNGGEIAWGNIAGSAWYLKPDKFDFRDDTLHANH
ncbi:hypothetical protein IIA79_01380, partial [bacterium]|nr:hypothetical protein [bacterium]